MLLLIDLKDTGQLDKVYLNTSNVTVNLNTKNNHINNLYYLNTSNVTVNLNRLTVTLDVFK